MDQGLNKNEELPHSEIAHPVELEPTLVPVPDQEPVPAVVEDLEQLNIFDDAIDAWVETRLNTIYDSSEKGQVVHQQLVAVDNAFIDSLADLLPNGATNGAVSALLNYASTRATIKQAELIATRESHGLKTRMLIHDSINEMWTAVGAERTREVNGPENHIAVSATFAEQLPLHTQQLLEHLFEIAPVQSEIHLAEVRDRVKTSLESIKDTAQDIAESRYLEADRTAARLYTALPGQALKPSEMYEILSALSLTQRELTLLAFKERYEVEFSDAVQEAYKSPLVQVKNFFKIPALRSALEEKFGFGVGLISVARVIFPDIKGIRGCFTGQYWKDYASKVTEFVKDLGNKVATPEVERLEALVAGDKLEAATHSLFIAVWERRNRDAIAGALLDLDPDERQIVEERFIEKYGQLLNVSGLIEAVENRFSESDAEYIEARLSGDDTFAHALLIRDVLTSRGGLERLNLLTSLTDDLELAELTAVLDKYREHFNVELDRDHLAPHFKSGLLARGGQFLKSMCIKLKSGFKESASPIENPILDWAEHLCAGERLEASAARLRAAMRGRSGEWPGVVFYEHTLEENNKIVSLYNKTYNRDFWKDFESTKGREATIIMQSLLDDNELTLAQQARHFMIGWGADSDGMRACFDGLSAKRQEKLTQEYAEEFKVVRWWSPKLLASASVSACLDIICRRKPEDGHRAKFVERLTQARDLDADIRSEFDGHNLFDALALRKGVVSEPTALMQSLLDRFNHEMAGSNYVPPEDRKTPVPERIRSWAKGTVTSILELEASFDETEHKWTNYPLRLGRKTLRLGLEVLQLVLTKESPDEACLQRDMDSAHKYYTEHLRDKPTPDEHTSRTFRQLVKLAQQSLDVRRTTQSKKGEALANTVSLVTTTAAWIGLGVMHFHIALVGGGTFAASLAGRAAAKYYHKRAGYGPREFGRDTYLSAVDGCTLSLGKLVKGYRALRFLGFGRAALSTALKFGMKKGLYHIGHTSLTNALLESKVSGHVRRQVAARREKFLEDYEGIIHKEVDRIARQNSWITEANDLRPVFRRVAKRLG